MKDARLSTGPESVRRLRRVLGRQPTTLQDELACLPTCAFSAHFWSERAWSEYAAVPAMSQITLALVREGGTTDAMGAIALIGADEVVHTELSRDLAQGLGGYTHQIPETSAYEPAALAEPSDARVCDWLVVTCISETISAALMRARLRHTKHPRVRAVLERVLRDERVHAQTAWRLAEQFVPGLDESARSELGQQASEMIEAIGHTFATAGLPEAQRREARRLREVCAAKGLGAAPADEADAVCMNTVTDTIVPRFALLGVRALGPAKE